MKNILFLKVILFVLIFPLGGKANSISFEDSLSKNLLGLVIKLDSITKVDSTLEFNSKSNRFIVFKSIMKIATQKDLIYLIKKHPNPTVKGYAYIGLLIIEYKKADVLYSKNFNGIQILLSDVHRIYGVNQAESFMKFVYPKRLRIKSAVFNNKTDVPDSSEKTAIEKENDIRKEQGLPKKE